MRWLSLLAVVVALGAAGAGPRRSPIGFAKVQIKMSATGTGFVAVTEVAFTATLRESIEPRFVLGGVVRCVEPKRELTITLGNLVRADELREGKPHQVRQPGPEPATPVARKAACRLHLRLEDARWPDEPHIDLADFCFKAGESKARSCS